MLAVSAQEPRFLDALISWPIAPVCAGQRRFLRPVSSLLVTASDLGGRPDGHAALPYAPGAVLRSSRRLSSLVVVLQLRMVMFWYCGVLAIRLIRLCDNRSLRREK